MEPEHTEVNITKPKKERTPAQKAATARALEALAAKRKQTKEAIEEPPQLMPPVTPGSPIASKDGMRRKPVAKPKPTPEPVQIPTDQSNSELQLLREEMKQHRELLLKHKAEPKPKAKRAVKKVVVEEYDDEEEDEEEPEYIIEQPIVRKKKIPAYAPVPAPNYNNRDLMNSIFFRNM